MLWAFEPVKYWQAAPNCSGSTTRRSTCSPVVGQDRGLGVAAADHLAHRRHRHERLAHGRGLARGRDDVDVGHRLAQPSQAAAVLGPLDRGQGLEARRRTRPRSASPPRSAGAPPVPDAAHPLDRVLELLLRLRAEAAQLAQRWPARAALSVVEVRDAELAAQAQQRLGTHAGDPAQLDERRRVLQAQLLELGDRPLVVELADLLGRARRRCRRSP